MGKKKIIVSTDILEEFTQPEQLDDISLKFVLSDEYHKVNIDLNPLLDGSLERRKQIHKFKEFLIKTPKSLSTKKAYYKFFKQMFLSVKNHSKKDLLTILSIYQKIQLNKFLIRQINSVSYQTVQNNLQVIFYACFNINSKQFLSIFPHNVNRTGQLDNSQILDENFNEKGFFQAQFKEVSKIFLRLHDFFEDIIINRPKNIYEVNFKYQNIYNLDVNLHWQGNDYLQNRKTFCLIVIFISLTGMNLSPLIKMKRQDIIIDKERGLISFKVTCNRKNKEQSHNYPMRENQLKFFEKMIENSFNISSKKDILFPFVLGDSEIVHFSHGIDNCYKLFNKGFCGEYEGMKINAKKLRHTFGSQFNDIDLRSVALFNSINVAAKNYSTGNSEENNKQLQNAMNIYTIALSNSENIKTVRENINKINVINIKDITSLKQENSQITSSGIFCLNSKEGKEPETFKRKITQLQLNNLDSINCANILACFNCKNSIIVNDFENIYLLKSFNNYLNNIVYESNTSSLFSDKNAVKHALIGINLILDSKIDKKIIKKVDKHISKMGNHTLWEINGEFV